MKDTWDFPGGPVVKNLPASAEDTGSISGPGRSHMSTGNWACASQLLSSQSRAHKVKLLNPMYLQPMLHDKKSHHDEKPKHRNGEEPCSPQVEKAQMQQRRPTVAKN